jgi:hypothetical protein
MRHEHCDKVNPRLDAAAHVRPRGRVESRTSRACRHYRSAHAHLARIDVAVHCKRLATP